MTEISFGDSVRVVSTPETDSLGVAGLVGQVYGITTPSVTGVSVIGDVVGDQAINVQLKERDEPLWFSPQLLELVDHAVGTEITIDGVPKKWIRSTDGDWNEIATKKPWWRVW
jgi:hypothetical protein